MIANQEISWSIENKIFSLSKLFYICGGGEIRRYCGEYFSVFENKKQKSLECSIWTDSFQPYWEALSNASYQKAAEELKKFAPKDDSGIDVIVATYYDLTLHYGSASEYSIFYRTGKYEFREFFAPYFLIPPPSDDWSAPHYESFRLAFFVPKSPAWTFEFPWPTGAGIGGEALGRKLLDENTMLVYGRRGGQEHLGPALRLCKGGGDTIDKFIFKKINNEWKVVEIEENIDQWTTVQGGDTEEECKEINQDRIEKYR